MVNIQNYLEIDSIVQRINRAAILIMLLSLILMSRLATTHAACINGNKYRAMTLASLYHTAFSPTARNFKRSKIRKSGSYRIVETLILICEPVQIRRLVRNSVRIHSYAGVFYFLGAYNTAAYLFNQNRKLQKSTFVKMGLLEGHVHVVSIYYNPQTGLGDKLFPLCGNLSIRRSQIL